MISHPSSVLALILYLRLSPLARSRQLAVLCFYLVLAELDVEGIVSCLPCRLRCSRLRCFRHRRRRSKARARCCGWSGGASEAR